MTEFTAEELRYMAAKALLPEKLVIDTATEPVRRFREAWMPRRKPCLFKESRNGDRRTRPESACVSRVDIAPMYQNVPGTTLHPSSSGICKSKIKDTSGVPALDLILKEALHSHQAKCSIVERALQSAQGND